MELKLFDLHCDTPYRMYNEHQPLKSNSLHVSIDKISKYKKYIQIAAIWSDKRKNDDEAYSLFWRILNNFKCEIESNRQSAAICRTFADVQQLPDKTAAFFLAVEDARILSGNIERMHELYDAGVRFMSLNWAGENALGGGYDTNSPLTHLGRSIVKMAFDLGITIDVSHSSQKVIDEIAEMAVSARRPILASHSDSNTIAVHPRNLTDEQFTKIKRCGGIVGISFARAHLCGNDANISSIASIIEHIEYFLGLDGQHTICLGCDFDGIETTPEGIGSIDQLDRLAEAMSARNFSDELIHAIFYQNAYNFLKRL